MIGRTNSPAALISFELFLPASIDSSVQPETTLPDPNRPWIPTARGVPLRKELARACQSGTLGAPGEACDVTWNARSASAWVLALLLLRRLASAGGQSWSGLSQSGANVGQLHMAMQRQTVVAVTDASSGVYERVAGARRNPAQHVTPESPSTVHAFNIRSALRHPALSEQSLSAEKSSLQGRQRRP